MLITHATLVTWESPNRLLPERARYIAGGLIRELAVRHPHAETLHVRGQSRRIRRQSLEAI